MFIDIRMARVRGWYKNVLVYKAVRGEVIALFTVIPDAPVT